MFKLIQVIMFARYHVCDSSRSQMIPKFSFLM